MENRNSTLLLYHTGAFIVNCPKHIENLEQVLNQIENDKNYVIVIDGNNKSFKLTEMPEHWKTFVQTSKGNLSRIDFEIGYKI